jgi:uncharacterized protein
MAASGLLALLDDIATILDDIALLTKVASQKTAGVLGDDLALNAQQVTGVRAERELPVVWAVAKGSALNKVILVPAALGISAVAPWAVTPLLMLGGLFLCFEGFEKLVHRWLVRRQDDTAAHRELLQAVADANQDMVAFERGKIKGAVRTDLVLSAEIVAITLGTVAQAPFLTQLGVLSAVAVIMTVGVYGFVALIVKLDDAGLHLTRSEVRGWIGAVQRRVGGWMLTAAPMLMKFLSIAGTAAMFLVGGGILMHGIPPLHHALATFGTSLAPAAAWLQTVLSSAFDALLGMVSGALAVALVAGVSRLRGRSGRAAT